MFQGTKKSWIFFVHSLSTLLDLSFYSFWGTFLDNRISIVNTGLEEPDLVEKLDLEDKITSLD